MGGALPQPQFSQPRVRSNPCNQVCDDPNQRFGQDKLQQRYDDASLMVIPHFSWPSFAYRHVSILIVGCFQC